MSATTASIGVGWADPEFSGRPRDPSKRLDSGQPGRGGAVRARARGVLRRERRRAGPGASNHLREEDSGVRV